MRSGTIRAQDRVVWVGDPAVLEVGASLKARAVTRTHVAVDALTGDDQQRLTGPVEWYARGTEVVSCDEARRRRIPPWGQRATTATIADVLARHRFLFTTEAELQRGLTDALRAAGMTVAREVRLNTRDRIDLLVDDTIGVEVKITGSWRDVDRQLRRYLESDVLDELLLVTAVARHRQIPVGAVGPRRPAGPKTLRVHQITGSGL